ncbi:hypothetical protein EST38_g6302 [Candolleomyces aberdarensis]|uniref:Ricin B lectin domain-containing protein n=1 Tax=Candolleomyces aberdarensis TaxID=2316362 RepID=A0A4Q2DK25_9AGAR|nr:hypothetical protein EST38_g6302 [Candolleomyces aberdarensis]
MRVHSALLSLLFATLASAQTYVVHNNCPSAIDLFIGQDSQGSLPRGARLTRTGLGTSAGFFYATNNGGGVVNGQLLAARAGFFFEPNYWYYYIVRDLNSNNFNTGISITPNQPEANGYCRTARCDSGDCTTAYTTPPVFHGGPPPPGSPPTSPPLYQCPTDPSTVSFDITWPSEVGTPVYHNFNPNKCIDVRGDVRANGTPVQIYDCNGTPAQRWVIRSGSTKVRLANSNFCLDAGSSPANGVQMKIWQCFDNLAAQQWTFTSDNRITLGGTPLCLDLTQGNTGNSNVLQTWECGNFNTNQAWSINA